ncbi:MAG: Zn-dependent protease [Chitinophagaceae bacterium]|nr:MAG: Zn-dependent protease [Chitinophagaceae bacterium]
MKILSLCLLMFLSGAILSSPVVETKPNRHVVFLQPFGNIAAADVHFVKTALQKVYPFIETKPALALPPSAFSATRNRYRADSLINFLRRRTAANSTTIGLTNHDISSTKGKHNDWGVMGLGFCPGNACVASSFRVLKHKRKEQLYKVAVHELGHTEGLPHCPTQSCFMADAKGSNPLERETGFCSKCRPFLLRKHWSL